MTVPSIAFVGTSTSFTTLEIFLQLPHTAIALKFFPSKTTVTVRAGTAVKALLA